MIKEAVLHVNTEEYIYPVSRNRLSVKIRVAAKDISCCKMVYWKRTEPEQEKTLNMYCTQREELFDYYMAEIDFSSIARYRKYYFVLTDMEGNKWFYHVYGMTKTPPDDGFFEFLYTNKSDVLRVPSWSDGIIFYQIFPERFFRGDNICSTRQYEPWGTPPDRENYMGGNINGIISKLPYLCELGAECLYINPVFKGDFNHKYATTDYFTIDPDFGSNEDFRRLVENCHERGIRIILDGVFNHTGCNFPPFLDLLEKGEKSEYRDWYLVEHFPLSLEIPNFECVGGYKYMPKLNTYNTEVQNFIIRVMEYWIRDFHIDGWRLDVADETDDSLWQNTRKYLKEKYPEILLLGETWGYGGKLVLGNRLDSVMNYMFRDAVRDFFALNKITVHEFDSRINHMLSLYRPETAGILFNPVDSHDTERFLSLCNEKKEIFKIAVAFQMLFRGSPSIYYGNEVGISGGNDPDCRRCMIWDTERDENLFEWYKCLIKIRKENEEIRKGKFFCILRHQERKIYGFSRMYGGESICIIIHFGEGTEKISCPVPEKDEKYIDLMNIEEGVYHSFNKITEDKIGQMEVNSDIMEYGGRVDLQMCPYSVRVIKKIKEEKKDEKR